ncbi:MAG: S8 family serine peptidase [Chloroflexota bacterium]
MKTKISFPVILILILSLAATPAFHVQAGNSQPAWHVLSVPENTISASLRSELNQLQQDETITVIVQLRQKANLPSGTGLRKADRVANLIKALTTTADKTQGPVKKVLDEKQSQGAVKSYTEFWIFNGFSITASPDVIQELASHPDVFSITSDELDVVPAGAAQAFSNPEVNVSLINAPALWSMGYGGQGIVVASMDSGVNMAHTDLASRWRSGANSWFDPYGQHPASPFDLSGHGTWTMGVMVGGDSGGASIGVAPGAQWIAVKMFNDAGTSTATAIHQGYQWLLNPDGDPATDDAPHVVNNSWTFAYPGCNLDFEPDLQALRAAGILPVFAAGNGGPSANTSYSPANNPSAFAVGAINNGSSIYGLSSRGATKCGGSAGVFPELVAPGVNVYTTDLGGFYTTASGTSLAAPHVAGGLALLLSAYPDLSAGQQGDVLKSSAVDLGVAGPDNIYGYGRLNLLAAYQQLSGAPTATPIVQSTFTATLPSETPTALPTQTMVPASPTPLPTYTSTATFIPSSSTPLPTYTSTSTFIPSSPTPLPTWTASPTRTATLVPTATSTNAAVTALHVGDLDRASVGATSKSWNATITIRVHDASEQPLSGVTVYLNWTNGVKGTASCTTNTNGTCSVSKTISNRSASATLTVTNAAKASFTYAATDNHDPDGDSNGTTIVISRP